jgi:hypothetical protein
MPVEHLIATTLEWNAPIVFRSALDEKAFFSWLASIPGVERGQGRGRTLLIHLRSERPSKTAMRELTSLYHRYGGDLKELARFETPGLRA